MSEAKRHPQQALGDEPAYTQAGWTGVHANARVGVGDKRRAGHEGIMWTAGGYNSQMDGGFGAVTRSTDGVWGR